MSFRRGNGEARRAAQFVLAWCRGSDAAKEQTQLPPGDLSHPVRRLWAL